MMVADGKRARVALRLSFYYYLYINNYLFICLLVCLVIDDSISFASFAIVEKRIHDAVSSSIWMMHVGACRDFGMLSRYIAKVRFIIPFLEYYKR